MKKKFIDYYMKLALDTAALSYAKRLKVGTVVVSNNAIFTGYNGMPEEWDNICEEYIDPNGDKSDIANMRTRREVLHSEMNGLMKITKSTESANGATMFVTHAPCIDCAKAIYQAGIKTVYYHTWYRDEEGLDFLRKSGINTQQYEV